MGFGRVYCVWVSGGLVNSYGVRTGDCAGYFFGSDTKSLLSLTGFLSSIERNDLANCTSDILATYFVILVKMRD